MLEFQPPRGALPAPGGMESQALGFAAKPRPEEIIPGRRTGKRPSGYSHWEVSKLSCRTSFPTGSAPGRPGESSLITSGTLQDFLASCSRPRNSQSSGNPPCVSPLPTRPHTPHPLPALDPPRAAARPFLAGSQGPSAASPPSQHLRLLCCSSPRFPPCLADSPESPTSLHFWGTGIQL